MKYSKIMEDPDFNESFWFVYLIQIIFMCIFFYACYIINDNNWMLML